jgi:hypothetical protein
MEKGRPSALRRLREEILEFQDGVVKL